jgi:taurine dioxygenase
MSAPSASAIALSIAPQAFDIRPFNGAVGAEIIGLDLALPVSDQDFARIHRAHLEHHVLVFRDQRITPQQQIDFSRRFGILQIQCSSSFC